MLETFYQNIQSSESWALGLQINKSSTMMTLIRAFGHHGLQSLIRFNLLSCHVLSCRDLQNFKPSETGDVQSELLVFRFLWRLVLESLQVLNPGDAHQNFCLRKIQALDQKHNLQRLELAHQNFLSRIFRSFLATLQSL